MSQEEILSYINDSLVINGSFYSIRIFLIKLVMQFILLVIIMFLKSLHLLMLPKNKMAAEE